MRSVERAGAEAPLLAALQAWATPAGALRGPVGGMVDRASEAAHSPVGGVPEAADSPVVAVSAVADNPVVAVAAVADSPVVEASAAADSPVMGAGSPAVEEAVEEAVQEVEAASRRMLRPTQRGRGAQQESPGPPEPRAGRALGVRPGRR